MKILSAALVAVAGLAAMTGCCATGIDVKREQEATHKQGKYYSVNPNVILSSDTIDVSVCIYLWVDVSYSST